MDRDEMLFAAALLLAKDPSASMERIAAAVRVSRATLHRHFPGRAELVRELAAMAIDRTEAAVDAARPAEGEPAAALERLAAGLVPLGAMYEFLITLPEALEDERYDRVEDRITELFLRGQRAGDFRPDLPAAWLTVALEGLIGSGADAVARGLVAPYDEERLVVASIMAMAGRR